MEKLKYFIFVCCGYFYFVKSVLPYTETQGGKFIEPQKYNDGVIMAHILGSGVLNFLHYFYILDVECENKNREFWRYTDKEFTTCKSRTSLIPADVRSKPYGTVEKACESWRLNKQCYIGYRDNLDDCGINDKATDSKGEDAYIFTDAYANYICRDPEEAEQHLFDRFTKKHVVAPGVFQCFPQIQDRIVNCIKKDAYTYTTTLCSKFYTVRECFAKFYSEEHCDDDDTIIFMEDMFHSMGISMKCPGNSDEWIGRLEPAPTPYKPKTTSTYGYGSNFPVVKTTSTTEYVISSNYPPYKNSYGYGGGGGGGGNYYGGPPKVPNSITVSTSTSTGSNNGYGYGSSSSGSRNPTVITSSPYGSTGGFQPISKPTSSPYGSTGGFQPVNKPKPTTVDYGSGFPYY